MANINIQLFSDVIMKNLFQNNLFMYVGTDHSKFVTYLNGDGSQKSAALVHVPSAGNLPVITKNRSIFPVNGIQRTDSDLTYNINEYSTAPWMLQYSEAVTVEYSKVESLLKEMNETILDTVGNETAYAWAPSSATTFGVTRIFRTTGPTGSTALASGATGTRKSMSLNDFAIAKNLLDSDKFPTSERYFIIPSSIWNLDILQLSNVQKFLELGSKSGLREGQIDPQTIPGRLGRIYGFEVIERPTVVVYLTGATPVLQTIGDNGVPTASNATDNQGAIFFHKSAVANAIGQPVLFYNENRADYFGSLFSALIRHGASPLYSTGQVSDFRGIGAIVQINISKITKPKMREGVKFLSSFFLNK